MKINHKNCIIELTNVNKIMEKVRKHAEAERAAKEAA